MELYKFCRYALWMVLPQPYKKKKSPAPTQHYGILKFHSFIETFVKRNSEYNFASPSVRLRTNCCGKRTLSAESGNTIVTL